MTQHNNIEAAQAQTHAAHRAPRVPFHGLVETFIQTCGQAQERAAVLELTHIEHKLLSEAEELRSYLRTRAFKSDVDAGSDDLRMTLTHYASELSLFMLSTGDLFDTTQRLVHPYYRDALQTGMRVKLEARNTPNAIAFSFVEELRKAPKPRRPAGEAPWPDQ